MVLVVVLALGLLIRLPWLATDWRVTGDLGLHRHWVTAIQTRGMFELYDGREQLYPPLSTLLFGGVAVVEKWLSEWGSAQDATLNVLNKLPACLADIGTAALIAAAVWVRPKLAVISAALYVLNPATVYVSAFWGQLDSVYTFFMVAGLVLFQKSWTAGAWGSVALALGIKVQAIALVPVLGAATFVRGGWRGVLRGGLAFGIVTALLYCLWWLSGALDKEFWSSMLFGSRTPRVDVSAFNLWYFVLRDEVHTTSSLDQLFFLPFDYRTGGFLLYGLFTALIAVRVWRVPQSDLALAAALSCLGLFMLPTEVHERFLFPVLGFVLLAAAQASVTAPGAARSRWLWVGYALFTLTLSFNLVTIAQPFIVAPFNLVAQPTDSDWVAVLKLLAVGTALVNLILLLGLMGIFWSRSLTVIR